MDEIRGILFSVIRGKGSRSEGPEYYIKPLDDYKRRWSEILVRKKTRMWETDPELDRFLDQEVLILGEIIETKHTITVDYFEVKKLE
jgi:hypothetical protein